MTEDDFLAARDLMEEAVARAKMIVRYFAGNDETAQVDLLEDGQAVVTTWQATTDYDCSVLEKETQCFPGHLLFCSQAEAEQWLAEEKVRRDAAYKAQQEAIARQNEATELAILARLKAKYEKSPSGV